MTRGKVYKHINNTDVAFRPTRIIVNHRLQIYKCSGYWLNIVNPQKVDLIAQDEIHVKIADLNNWVEYE